MSHALNPICDGMVSSVFEREGTKVLRLEWGNSAVRKDKLLIGLYSVIWLMFAPASVYMTVMLFVSEPGGKAETALAFFFQCLCLGTWLVCGWAITLAFPYMFRGFLWQEWIEISARSISFGAEGLWSPAVRAIPLTDVEEFFLGFCGGAGDWESCLTLNLYHSPTLAGNPSREMLGFWLAPDIKTGVFDAIKEFVSANKVPVKMRNELSADNARIVPK